MIRVAVYMLALCACPFLQGQTQLQYGDNHESFITEYGEIDEYQFQGTDGDIIFIRMRDETLVDSHIKLYDPDGDLIIDHFSDGGEAKIKDFTLLKSGIYKLKVADKNHNDIGKYGLSIHQLNRPTYAEEIPCFHNINERMEQIVGIKAYRFEAEEGDVLHTQMRALTEHFEPLFYIYDENGKQLYKSSKEGRMAIVDADNMPYDGMYYLYLMDKGGNDMDEYGFSLQLLNHHECVSQMICCETSMDIIPHIAARNAYRLILKKDQKAIIQMRADIPELESMLHVYNEEGHEMEMEWGSDKMVDIEVNEKEMGSSILIIADDYHGNDTGLYGIHIQALIENHCADFLSCQMDEVEGNLDFISQAIPYEISGRKGESWTFKMKEGNEKIEPHLRLYDPLGNMMMESSGATETSITGTFDLDGIYLLFAGDKSGNDIGRFSVIKELPEMDINMPSCIPVFIGYEDAPCTLIIPDILGKEEMNLHYFWTTGESTESIEICSGDESQIGLIVWSDMDCAQEVVYDLNIIDLSCGEMGDKVRVCHHPPGGANPKEICIDTSAVAAHIDQEPGHEGCHFGPCSDDPCEEDSGFSAPSEKVVNAPYQSESERNEISIFPNPATEEINISWKFPLGEDARIRVMDVLGNQYINQPLLQNDMMTLNLTLENNHLREGMYIVVVGNKYYSIAEKMQIVK